MLKKYCILIFCYTENYFESYILNIHIENMFYIFYSHIMHISLISFVKNECV